MKQNRLVDSNKCSWWWWLSSKFKPEQASLSKHSCEQQCGSSSGQHFSSGSSQTIILLGSSLITSSQISGSPTHFSKPAFWPMHVRLLQRFESPQVFDGELHFCKDKFSSNFENLGGSTGSKEILIKCEVYPNSDHPDQYEQAVRLGMRQALISWRFPGQVSPGSPPRHFRTLVWILESYKLSW